MMGDDVWVSGDESTTSIGSFAACLQLKVAVINDGRGVKIEVNESAKKISIRGSDDTWRVDVEQRNWAPDEAVAGEAIFELRSRTFDRLRAVVFALISKLDLEVHTNNGQKFHSSDLNKRVLAEPAWDWRWAKDGPPK